MYTRIATRTASTGRRKASMAWADRNNKIAKTRNMTTYHSGTHRKIGVKVLFGSISKNPMRPAHKMAGR
jgi:hypothetical protein